MIIIIVLNPKLSLDRCSNTKGRLFSLYQYTQIISPFISRRNVSTLKLCYVRTSLYPSKKGYYIFLVYYRISKS